MNIHSPANGRHLRLHPADNVIVAVDPLEAGRAVENVKVAARIPRGHKMATAKLAKGEAIIKYGQIIGFAHVDIAPGQHVHSHNCTFAAFERDFDHAADARPEDILPVARQATFEGYRRKTGRAGTRNYIGILTSVNCSASVAKFMAEEINRSGLLADYPNLDGVIPLVHGGGCALDVNGEGYEVLKRTQWGYATNPNMGGVVMVGLGCEGFQIGRWKEAYNVGESETFRTMTIQEVGGTRKTIMAGVEAIKAMLPV
ncbi:MAG: UxaA family hydrolase, partial [Beijerinckiaceae bacterium]